MMPMSALRDVWEAQLQDGEPFLTALMRGRSIPSSPHRRRPSGSGPTCTVRPHGPGNLETPVPQHRRDGSPPAPHMEPEDTSICLGDVAHPDTWRKRRTLLDLRNCPGRRLLGIGNHDMLNSDHLRNAGFVDQHPAALCATDPPLALTHMPGAVNVHGHLHDADAPSARHFQRQRRTHPTTPPYGSTVCSRQAKTTRYPPRHPQPGHPSLRYSVSGRR